MNPGFGLGAPVVELRLTELGQPIVDNRLFMYQTELSHKFEVILFL